MYNIYPRLSLCMIVRNEQDRLRTSILSLSGHADEIVIVDTGSTDHTLSLAKQLATLTVQIRWNDDFSEARNLSLEEATGDWILVMDADETLHPDDALLLKKMICEGEADGYYVKIVNRMATSLGDQEEHFPAIRLFRNDSANRFTGAIHEQIRSIPAGKLAASDIRIIHHGNVGDMSKRRDRSVRNIRILRKEAEHHPKDEFTLYNLGVEYTVIRQYKDAIIPFEHARNLVRDKQPWVSRLYKLLVYCYLKIDMWEQANSILEQGIGKFPDFTDLYYLKGMLCTAQKKYKEALLAFYHCLAIGDAVSSSYLAEKGMGTDKAYFALGSIYEALGERLQSQLCYQNAFKWNPDHSEAGQRWMKAIINEQPDIRAAIKSIVASLTMKHPEAWLTLSEILAEKREFSLSHYYRKLALNQGAVLTSVKMADIHCSYLEGGLEKAWSRLLGRNNKTLFRELLEGLILLLWKEKHAKLTEGAEKFPLSVALKESKDRADSWLEIRENGI